MKFGEIYTLDQSSELPLPVFVDQFDTDSHLNAVKSGSYNSGLLHICDSEHYGAQALSSWSDLVGSGARVIAYLAWGDFICASYRDQEFYLVLAQENHRISLGNSIDSVFNLNLVDPDFRRELMWENKLADVRKKYGQLEYHQCYILKPWQCIGGREDKHPYTRGDFSVYVDLVGQHW